jgi:polar amino acid transport system substrate-binding protein
MEDVVEFRALRKSVIALAVSAFLATGLVACGSPGGASAPAAAPRQAASTAAAKGVEVPHGIRKAGVVNVAVYLAYPPYSYTDSSGRPAGLELEMARAVAQKMGVSVRFHSIEFPAMIPAISNGRYDWALGTISDLKERRKVVDIMDWSHDAMFVQVKAGNPHNVDPSDLCGVRFGHVQGSAQIQAFESIAAQCAKDGKSAPTQVLFQDVGTQLQALRNDRFAADLQDPAAGAQTERQTNDALIMLPGNVPTLAADPAGWVFAKGNQGLEKAVLQSIDALIKDGTWQKLMADNGMSDVAIVPPTLNTVVPNY